MHSYCSHYSLVAMCVLNLHRHFEVIWPTVAYELSRN